MLMQFVTSHFSARRISWAAFFLLATLTALSCTENTDSDATPCVTSDDCKRNRICRDGACIFPGADDESEPSITVLCAAICGNLATCEALDAKEVFGATESSCTKWCTALPFTADVVACVLSSSCNLPQIKTCLGLGGGDVDNDADTSGDVDNTTLQTRCAKLCDALDDCSLLSSDIPVGATAQTCQTWCVNGQVSADAVACVLSVNQCAMSGVYECLGFNIDTSDGDKDQDTPDVADSGEETASECVSKGTLAVGDNSSGDTSSASNSVQDANACAGLSFPGKDQYWTLEVPANTAVEIKVTALSFNPAIWVLKTCGGPCAAAGDQAGTEESLTISASDVDRTLIVVVDAAEADAGGQYLIGVKKSSR